MKIFPERLSIGHKTIIFLAMVMAAIAISVGGVALLALYEAAFQEAENRLSESAKSHSKLINSISNFNDRFSSSFSGSTEDATISQIRNGLVSISGTSELTVGKKTGDQIIFILRQQSSRPLENVSVPYNSQSAEPMRRALSGRSGTLVGLDYRNRLVLAAHEPIYGVDLGVVVKMDISEIREPFILAGVTTGGFALVIIFMGVILFVRISNPMIEEIANEGKRLRNILDASPVPLTITNLSSSQIRYANPAAEKLFGADTNKFIGYPANEYYVNQEDRASVVEALMENGKIDNYELLIKKIDGSPMLVYLSGKLSLFENEEVMIAGIVDITEHKKMEEALRQSQKMEAVGQLTGGIAHDFNNMLGVIMGNLDLLRRRVVDDAKATEYVQEAYEGSRRGANITKKLLSFSRGVGGNTQITNINDFITGMENLITKSLTPKIAVEIFLADDIWPVNIDPGEFEDALLNLSLNANDAMPDGGSLVIESSNKVLDEQYVRLNPGSTPGEYVMISVSDTGTGMTPEMAVQVFQPFFTSKDAGKGTGLGLSMVYGFIQRSGGHIKVYSEPGQGSTFNAYLPRAFEGTSGVAVVNKEIGDELPRGDEIILVVDDEEGLVKVAVSYLEDLGYKTQTATNGKEAWKILKEPHQIDLVFSDVVMPGDVDGYDLAKATLKDYPNVKFLLTSGFTSKREGVVNGDVPLFAKLSKNLLNKPYNQAELAVAIRQVLDKEDIE